MADKVRTGEVETTIDLVAIKAAKDLDPRVRETYEYLHLYKSGDKRVAWLAKMEKCWDAVADDIMFSDKETKAMEKEGQEPRVINKLTKGVQGSTALVTDKRPESKMMPVGSGDLYLAELLNRAHNVVWDKNDGTDVVHDFVESSKIAALGFIDVKLNPNKGPFGRIEFEETPSDDIFIDQESRKQDLSDTHIIKAKLRPRTYLKDKYDVTDEDLKFGPLGSDVDDTGKSTGVTGADNYTEQDDHESLGPGVAEQKDIWEIEAWMLKTVIEDWYVYFDEAGKPVSNKIPDSEDEDENGEKVKVDPKGFIKAWNADPENLPDPSNPKDKRSPAETWKRTLEKRYLRIIVGRKLISETKDPHGIDGDGNPITAIVMIRHNRSRNAYGTCPTFHALPMNIEKNKRRAQFNHLIANAANAPIVESAQGIQWTKPPGTAGAVAKVSKNVPIPPTRMQSGAMDAGKFAMSEEMSDKDIQDQYDLHDVMMGKMPPGQTNMAGRTVLALQDMGGMMTKPFLRRLEGAMVRVSRVIVALILKHWDRYQFERLIEQDEMQTWTPDGPYQPSEEEDEQQEAKQKAEISAKWKAALDKLSPEDGSEPDITIMDIDIKIIAGSSMPTNRIAKMSMAMEMFKIGLWDQPAALEYSDDVGADKIIQRMKAAVEAAQQGALEKQAKAALGNK